MKVIFIRLNKILFLLKHFIKQINILDTALSTTIYYTINVSQIITCCFQRRVLLQSEKRDGDSLKTRPRKLQRGSEKRVQTVTTCSRLMNEDSSRNGIIKKTFDDVTTLKIRYLNFMTFFLECTILKSKRSQILEFCSVTRREISTRCREHKDILCLLNEEEILPQGNHIYVF